MKRFIGFVIKEFYHIVRDPRTLAILIGMPVVQLLLFGYVITNEIKDARLAILDESKDHVTQKITQRLLSSNYFLLVKNLQTDADIDKLFKEGNIKEVIVFEPGFADKFEKQKSARVQVIADASDPNTASLLVNYTTAIINDYVKEVNRTEGGSIQTIPVIRMAYNPNLKGVYMFVPGIIALLMTLISALMTSISITREKELGTMEVLLVSPLKPLQIVLGKVTPYILLAFFDAITIIIVGHLVFKVPLNGSPALLLAESVLYIITALSIGILISSITSSQQVAMMASLVGLMLPTILLSGFIFPIENMPLILQGLCQLMPPRWFITIIKDIMLKGSSFSYIWKETSILIGMTFIFIMISVKKFKIRLE